MTDDLKELQVTCQLVELGVILYDVVLENVITHRVVLAEVSVFLQLFIVLIAEREVDACSVFDRLQEAVTDVTVHIDRRTGHLHIAVKHNTNEGHCIAGFVETAGIQRYIHNVVNVLPGVRVCSVCHDFIEVLGHGLEQIYRELLGVCAVVRLILIEVGVEVRSESCDRNTALAAFRIILEQVL